MDDVRLPSYEDHADPIAVLLVLDPLVYEGHAGVVAESCYDHDEEEHVRDRIHYHDRNHDRVPVHDHGRQDGGWSKGQRYPPSSQSQNSSSRAHTVACGYTPWPDSQPGAWEHAGVGVGTGRTSNETGWQRSQQTWEDDDRDPNVSARKTLACAAAAAAVGTDTRLEQASASALDKEEPLEAGGHQHLHRSEGEEQTRVSVGQSTSQRHVGVGRAGQKGESGSPPVQQSSRCPQGRWADTVSDRGPWYGGDDDETDEKTARDRRGGNVRRHDRSAPRVRLHI